MAKNSAVNLDITNNADGFDVTGGTTPRKLTLSAGDVAMEGGGTTLDGELLIGHTSNNKFMKASATAGENIVLTAGAGSLTIAAPGWVPSGETWTYASADDPTFTFTISGDLSTKYSAGMKVKLTQTTVKYFIITKVAYSNPTTTITVYGGTDYDLANAAITSPYFSIAKTPQGFPMDRTKWTVSLTDSSDQTQSTPTASTWYNLGSLSLTIPIGSWDVSYNLVGRCVESSATTTTDFRATLSTANNSESDTNFTVRVFLLAASAAQQIQQLITKQKDLVLTSKTTYYLNAQTQNNNIDSITFRGSNNGGDTVIRAICTYL